MDRPFHTTRRRARLQPWPQRAAAVAGALLAVTFAAHIALAIAVGHSADRPNNLTDVFAGNEPAARAIFILLFVSISLFIPFLWGIARIMDTDGERTNALPVFAFGACAACLLLLALFIAGEAALATRGTVSAQVGLEIFTTKAYVETVTDMVLASLSIAGGLMLRRTQRLPRWLGWLGIAGGAAYGVGVFSDISVSPHINSRPLEAAGVTLVILWIVLTSVAMLRPAAP